MSKVKHEEIHFAVGYALCMVTVGGGSEYLERTTEVSGTYFPYAPPPAAYYAAFGVNRGGDSEAGQEAKMEQDDVDVDALMGDILGNIGAEAAMETEADTNVVNVEKPTDGEMKDDVASQSPSTAESTAIANSASPTLNEVLSRILATLQTGSLVARSACCTVNIYIYHIYMYTYNILCLVILWHPVRMNKDAAISARDKHF